MTQRSLPNTSKRWVIKLGSAILTNDGKGLDTDLLANLVKQIAYLYTQGIQPVIVSSGAIALGKTKIYKQPKSLVEHQACAAIGQMELSQAYEVCFRQYGIHTAQILLTHDDLADRKRYLNARATICYLLQLGIVPIINENDTVATKEIEVGDNDSLAGFVTNVIDADILLLLTDQMGIFDADPRISLNAQFISDIRSDDAVLDAVASPSKGVLGKGGMYTKIKAAKLSARSGANTIIANGRETNIIIDCFKGKVVGSYIQAGVSQAKARKNWLASQLQIRGVIYIDTGAQKALLEKNVSILAVGVTKIEGAFDRGDLIECRSQDGKALARGLINYRAKDMVKICGKNSKEIENILGYMHEPEVLDRNNLVLV